MNNYEFQIKATDKTAPAFNSVNRSLQTVNKNAQASGQMMGRLGRNAGQAGIQIQQFVGQIQGGQSALLALSQQGADLGFVLGSPLVGAIIGIGASIAGFLAPSILGAKTNIQELTDEIERLDGVQKRSLDQSRFLAQQREEAVQSLSDENVQIAEQIKLIEERIRKQSSAGTGTDTGEFAISRSAEANQLRYADSIAESNKELVTLRANLTTNNQKIIEHNEAITDLNSNTTKVSAEIERLTSSLESEIVALESGAQAAEVYSTVQRLVGTEQEEQLPVLIELINKKYELRSAQLASKEAAKEEANAWNELERDYQQWLNDIERAEELELRQSESRQKKLSDLELEIVAYQQGSDAVKELNAARALGVGATEEEIESYIRLNEQLTQFKDAQKIQTEGYQALLDIADAYYTGMEGKQAAYARVAIQIAGTLLDAEKRAAIGGILSNSYDAAMKAFDSLAGIPFVGPALGAAAAAGVIATGGLYAAKVSGIASFDGGGFTGTGPRSGGVDGKGGFPAILHPWETVIDHTKDQPKTGDNYNISLSFPNAFTVDKRSFRELRPLIEDALVNGKRP